MLVRVLVLVLAIASVLAGGACAPRSDAPVSTLTSTRPPPPTGTIVVQ